jgi:hypothetical protein
MGNKTRTKSKHKTDQEPRIDSEIEVSELYNKSIRLEFKPSTHRYKIFEDGQLVKPKPPSVTTITSLADFGKSAALQSWAVRMCLEVCRQRILPDQIHGSKFLEEAFRDAAANYRNVRDKAADVGTLAHGALERYFTEPDAAPPLAGTPIRARYDEALNWFKQYVIEPIGSEVKVYSKKHKYCGILDNIARVNGVVSLIDYKAAKTIRKPYEMQVAGYIGAYEEEHPEIRVEQAWILQIGEDRTIPYRYGRDKIKESYEAFLCLRKLYEWERTSGKIVPEEEDWIEAL